jgi:hypothetical protein
MRHQVRSHAAVREIQQMKSRRTRGEGEIRNADRVAVSDAQTMPLQCIECAPKHTGRYRGTSLPAPSECGQRSKSDPGNRASKKCTP